MSAALPKYRQSSGKWVCFSRKTGSAPQPYVAMNAKGCPRDAISPKSLSASPSAWLIQCGYDFSGQFRNASSLFRHLIDGWEGAFFTRSRHTADAFHTARQAGRSLLLPPTNPSKLPNVIRNAGLQYGSASRRLVNTAEVVIGRIVRKHRATILELL